MYICTVCTVFQGNPCKSSKIKYEIKYARNMLYTELFLNTTTLSEGKAKVLKNAEIIAKLLKTIMKFILQPPQRVTKLNCCY